MRNNHNKKINIIIGASLDALLYAIKCDFKLLYVRDFHPSPIDKKILFEGVEYSPGTLWKILYYSLTLSGNILFSDKIDNIRIEEEELKVFTKRARRYEVKYEKLHIFDDYNVSGVPSCLLDKENSLIEVRDWFDVKSGMKHQHDLLLDNSSFVSKVVFYQSNRIDGNHDLKDAVAISHLTEEQLKDFQYSDVSARFKTIHMMKTAGIRGTRNGRDSKNKSLYKHYAIKLENRAREVVYEMKKYKSTERLVFKYGPIDDILNREGVSSNATRIFHKHT